MLIYSVHSGEVVSVSSNFSSVTGLGTDSSETGACDNSSANGGGVICSASNASWNSSQSISDVLSSSVSESSSSIFFTLGENSVNSGNSELVEEFSVSLKKFNSFKFSLSRGVDGEGASVESVNKSMIIFIL